MDSTLLYQLLAVAVLVLHFSFVVFVVGGFVLIVIGNLRGWRWVNRWWFRIAHVAAIVYVVVQTWLGQDCPLTTLESWLRVQAGSSGYRSTFLEHWLQSALFYEAPFWLFTLIYTGFGLLVLATWRYFPPTRPARRT